MTKYRILKYTGSESTWIRIVRQRRFLFWTWWSTLCDFEGIEYSFTSLEEAMNHLMKIEKPIEIEVLREVMV